MTNTRPRIEDWCRCGDGRWHPWILMECPGDRPEERGDVVPVTPFLSAALDQIYLMRKLASVHASMLAGVANGERLTLKRRARLAEMVEQMRKVARGNRQAMLVPEEISSTGAYAAMREAGWGSGLTRHQWEHETFDEDGQVTW